MSWPEIDDLEIAPREVAELRDSGCTFTFIDCREADEWNFCRLDGAALMPLSRFGEMARERFTSVDEHIVIYCHHGMRSAQAAHFLRQYGLKYVWSMAGGIEGWSLEIDPGVPRY